MQPPSALSKTGDNQMKKLLIIGLVFFMSTSLYAIDTVNTNDAPTMDNLMAQYEQAKGIIAEWQVMVDVIKAGFSLPMIWPLVKLILASLIAMGVAVIILLRIIAFFTPDAVDKKLLVVEDWITKYMIKPLITALTKLRAFKKK
jgi:hypothetical protein